VKAFCFDDKDAVKAIAVRIRVGKYEVSENAVTSPALDAIILFGDTAIPEKKFILVVEIPSNLTFQIAIEIILRNIVE
jgi:hypothetical protein